MNLNARRLALLLPCLLVISCGSDPAEGPADAGNRDGGAGSDLAGPDGADKDAPTSDGGGQDATTDGGAEDASLPDGAVKTTTGPVIGTEEGGVISYLGIPYAEPPLGDRRFRPPVARAPWEEPLLADTLGPVCPQRDGQGNQVGDEDCLFLNVWAPAGAKQAPVMVFLHGGGFVQGSGSEPLYDGGRFAAGGVVLVTLNYRLGALGFLATEELAAEGKGGSAGNYGFLDQVLALEWVRDNAAAFGGDPANVTIFGESAGGVSVCGHLGAPASEGLFARAIIESGSGCGNFARLRQAGLAAPAAVEVGASFVSAAGCAGVEDVLGCLRKLPASDAVAAQFNLDMTALGLPPFGLVVDGVTFPDDPASRFRDGSARDVPVLTGSNADEATIFTVQTAVPTEQAYETLVNAVLGPLGPAVLKIYAASDFVTPKAAYNALFSDVAFICPALRFAEITSGGTEPSYAYHFTRTLGGAAAVLGAFHGLELFYVFGNFEAAAGNYMPDADDESLRDDMMSAWIGFARDGSLPFAAYDPEDPTIHLFDVTPSDVAGIREGRCAELAKLGLLP